MKRKIIAILYVLVFVLSALLSSCTSKTEEEKSKDSVTITDKGSHYEVTLDFQSKISHKKVGEEYASKILQKVPNYEALMDSYLKELVGSDDNLNVFLNRVNDIKPQINQDYKDEIEGMASKFSGSNKDVLGDGKISLDELYLINLIPDVVRGTQCSALGVYGQRSETKHDMTARLLDWIPGSQNQFLKVQAVTTFKNGSKSICTIGILGYIGVASGFNDNKVFSAILDSNTGGQYSSKSKDSYPLDIRYALENYDTLDKVADYLKSPERNYAFGHVIFLSDPDTSKVLENNVSLAANSMRSIRTGDSELTSGIEWGISNSVASVNSFILKGNYSVLSNIKANTARWDSLKKQLLLMGDTVSLSELKEVATYHDSTSHGYQDEGNIYNTGTIQIIIFEPYNLDLQVFFRPKYGSLPNAPEFEKIEVPF